MDARLNRLGIVGLLLMGGWLAMTTASWAQRPAPGAWVPQIAIVWPHDGAGNSASVAEATYVNVSVWPTNAVRCDSEEIPPLTWAYGNSNALVMAAQATRQMREIDGVRFPTLEYNDIPVNSALVNRFYIASPVGPNSNVWVHAVDARTIQPEIVEPSGVVSPEGMAGLVAPIPRINVVWPHDGTGNYLPVESAPFVNVSVLMLDNLDRTMDIEYMPELSLLIAEGNDPLQLSEIVPVPVNRSLDGLAYRTWEFNDVPVKAGMQSHLVVMSQFGAMSVPWTHAADARTLLPAPLLPPPCVE